MGFHSSLLIFGSLCCKISPFFSGFSFGFSVLRKESSFYSILQENGINAELGLAASEDAILDTLSERAEREIVSGDLNEKNLIGHSAPFLSKLCRNFNLMQKVITNYEVVVRNAESVLVPKALGVLCY